MNYCVLVEINRFTIRFSYYTDGIGRFEPFDKDEPSKPLAVWFNGSSVIIGDDAKREAKRKTPNAFYDLLVWMQKQGHFDYANEKHEYNNLILYTIRAGLRNFYARILLNSEGSLDENMPHVPLLISMGSDIEENESAVIISQLYDNGFGNIKKINFDSFIIETFEKEGGTYLILSGFGENVLAKIYSSKHEDKFILHNAGKDPRVDKLAKLIWERTQAESNFLEFDNEIDELRRSAKNFIYSGESEADDNIVLSDGIEYPYYLTKDDMRLFNQDDSASFLNVLVNRVNQYVPRQQCQVILKGVLATNKYLIEKLRPEFHDIKVMEKDDIRDVLNKIVEWCKANNFKFAKDSKPVDTPNYEYEPQNKQYEGHTAFCGPSKREERDFNILKKQVEAYKNGCEYDKAMAVTKEFVLQMNSKGLNCFDDEIEKIETELEKLIDKRNSVSPTDERKFKHLERIVAVYVNKGDFSCAIEEIDNLSRDFAKRGISALDNKLSQIKSDVIAKMKTRPESKTANVSSRSGNLDKKASANLKTAKSCSVKKNDKGMLLMKEGKYKEARDKFRSEGRKDEADDCTKLIKWQRLFATYKAEVVSIAKTCNKAKAQSRIKEIREYVSLYKKYGIDAAELTLTINELDKIK